MKFDVTIIQTLEGHIEIEANSKKEAIEIANKRYNEDGDSLPDMDTVNNLEFEAIKSIEQEKCVHYREFGECACNNEPDELGECVYGDGVIHGEPICKHYQ